MEDPFEKIGEECIEQAEGVDCPPEAFRAGLKTLVSMLTERLEMEPHDDE